MKYYPILFDKKFNDKYVEDNDAVFSPPHQLKTINSFGTKVEYSYYDGTQTKFTFLLSVGDYNLVNSICFEEYAWFKHIVNGESKLLIFFPYEGFGLQDNDQFLFTFFNKLLYFYNIPPKNIRFLSGNLKVKKEVKRVFPQLEDSCIGVNYFSTDFMLKYLKKNRILTKTELTEFLKSSKEKEFIFKNAAARNHRVFLASYFHSKKILDKTSFSFLDSYDDIESSSNTPGTFTHNIKNFSCDPKERKVLLNSWMEFKKGVPYKIDMDPSFVAQFDRQSQFPIEITHKAFFTFTSETLVAETLQKDVLFITEKSYQNFAYYHPFILLGCPGTYEYLHKQGFETFPEIFNEDFDLEPNIYKRTRMILSEIEKFLQSDDRSYFYSDELAEKLIHNRSVLEKLNTAKTFVNKFRLCLKLDS